MNIVCTFQEASDLENTVGTSARRFEEYQFIERTQHSYIVSGIYGGRYFAISLTRVMSKNIRAYAIRH